MLNKLLDKLDTKQSFSIIAVGCVIATGYILFN